MSGSSALLYDILILLSEFSASLSKGLALQSNVSPLVSVFSCLLSTILIDPNRCRLLRFP